MYIYNYNFALIFEFLKIKIINKNTSLLKNGKFLNFYLIVTHFSKINLIRKIN